ncbi:MAG TPA: hypothetical protein VFW40_01065 [Capsulimonadaceae bacterium]|nr:hypothetical protein [Capsulimonadaceae bacterium]
MGQLWKKNKKIASPNIAPVLIGVEIDSLAVEQIDQRVFAENSHVLEDAAAALVDDPGQMNLPDRGRGLRLIDRAGCEGFSHVGLFYQKSHLFYHPVH